MVGKPLHGVAQLALLPSELPGFGRLLLESLRRSLTRRFGRLRGVRLRLFLGTVQIGGQSVELLGSLFLPLRRFLRIRSLQSLGCLASIIRLQGGRFHRVGCRL